MSATLTPTEMQVWSERLEQLGLDVRARIVQSRSAGMDMATPVGKEGGDTIFAIDRHVENVMTSQVQAWVERHVAVELVMEGMGQEGRQIFGEADAEQRFTLLVDPIDGTRNLMYDKRSAWFLACVVHTTHAEPRLRNAFAAAMVELPPSKQTLGDSFVATDIPGAIPGAGAGVVARRRDLAGHVAAANVLVRPSQAATLENGFAQVANFFPGTKVLASELMERIVTATLGEVQPGSAAVFDDQYITTGGQFVELMCGRDRFCCDLRPLFYRILAQRTGKTVRGLECHPYDAAGLLVAQRAGVVITDGFGRGLDAPMDVHSPVHWCGYANETLRRAIEPVIQEWLREQGLRRGSGGVEAETEEDGPVEGA